MSKFWSTLPKIETSKMEGVISYKEPFDFSYENVRVNEDITINIKMNEQIENTHVYFILENGLSNSGNSYLVNPKFLSTHISSTLRNFKNEILGFAVAVENTINLNGKKYETVLTTNMCVSVEHRKVNLAKYIISSIINYTFNNNIFMGYHFIGSPRTLSNIKCNTYFRPLDVKLALDYGYEVPLHEYDITTNSDYTIEPANWEDFNLVSRIKRHLNIDLTSKEFNSLLLDGEAYTIWFKSKPVGLFIYRPILVQIFKVKRLCPVARMLYFECLPRHAYHVTSIMINYLKYLNKFAVISGVAVGELSSEFLRKNLGFITSGETYLDFYNFNIAEEFRKPEHLNLLYI